MSPQASSQQLAAWGTLSNANISEIQEQWIQWSYLPSSPPYFCPNRFLQLRPWSAVSLHFADCILVAKAGQPQLTNQNAGSGWRGMGNLRKQTPAVNQKRFQRMITDGPTRGALLQILWATHFPSCCLHFSKIACSPLRMQIKNMAWDQFRRVFALSDR